MRLYTFFRSSAAYRVRIALNVKRQPYDSIPKALPKSEHRAEDYLSLNPQGLIPAIEVDGIVLAQSLAIIEYLNEKYPSPPLLPATAIDRGIVRSMALSIACDIHPLNNLRVLNFLREDLRQQKAEIDKWYRHWVTVGFSGLEVLVNRHSASSQYCFGDSVSIADVCLVPQAYNARRFQVDMTPFPTLTAITKHLESLPQFASASPEQQPDAWFER